MEDELPRGSDSINLGRPEKADTSIRLRRRISGRS